ncbi:MAG: hypothetical protein ABSG68_10045 [Thermoguttaceae bacterium]|jgi:hypothetical protein
MMAFKADGGVIEFLCPNGHRIHCGEEKGGRAAKCPRCGIAFRIPFPAEVELSETLPATGANSSLELADSAISRSAAQEPPAIEPPPQVSDAMTRAIVARSAGVSAGSVGESAGESTGVEGEAVGPQIEFLCPNGHHLHGPASLQGRPGECPRCASQFRIPVYGELSLEDEAGVEIAAESPAAPRPAGPPPAPGGQDDHRPLRELFARLWAAKGDGGRIELHLAGGEAILADRFADALSRQAHGVFAAKEADGTFTIVVVPWESVERISIRAVKNLPPEMRG